MKKIVTIIIILICIIMFTCKDMIFKSIYVIKYDNFVSEYSQEFDIDKFLIFAIIKAESNFDEKAVSNKGAKGLMQIMDSTAEDIAKTIDIELNDGDIMKPEINIRLGTKYISDLMKKYNNIELALAAYNAGVGNVDTWIEEGTLKKDGSNIENVPYKETNNYVRKILRDYDIYKKLYS